MKTDRHQKTSIRAKTRISLRWHYPNQVMGLNAQFTLSRFASSPVFFFSLLRLVALYNQGLLQNLNYMGLYKYWLHFCQFLAFFLNYYLRYFVHTFLGDLC